ncbi:MAG TPA: alpha/beta hydrolase [Solirubrobacteraceae bacterium]|nr:alpha/beta hydrolase [Solirubrobacteraceae bacterium]
MHELSGRGTPLLLVHATGFHGRAWQPVARALAPRFACLAPDLRGHGDSPPPDDLNFDWRGFAADVLSTVDRLGLERPSAAGHSSGATALLLAEEARPGTFAALYCFEPIIVPADPPLGRDPESWLAEATRRRRAEFPSRVEAERHYAGRPPLSDLDPTALRAYVEHGFEDVPEGGVRLKCRPEYEALVYEMATAHDCFSHLDRVRCPVTLARGGRSEAFTHDRQAAIAARLPRVRCEEHPALGHLGPLEEPAAIAASIGRALTG